MLAPGSKHRRRRRRRRRSGIPLDEIIAADSPTLRLEPRNERALISKRYDPVAGDENSIGYTLPAIRANCALAHVSDKQIPVFPDWAESASDKRHRAACKMQS